MYMKLSPFLTYSLINNHLIHTSINISQATYCKTNKWDCKTCSEDNTIYNTIEKFNEKAIVGINDPLNTLFISFRGSSNIQNWVDNIQFSHTCYNNDICVETGINKIYQHYKTNITQTIETTMNVRANYK